MTSNKLTFNTLKTEFLVIASRAKVKEVKETLCVHVQDEPIYRSPYAKSLGFYIDQQLDWEDYVNHVVKNAIPVFQLFGVPGGLYQRKHYLQFIVHLLRVIYVMASQYGVTVGILYSQDYNRYRIGQHGLLLVPMSGHHLPLC